MRIDTKAEMYELYHRGRFGNRLRAWPTVEAYLASGFDGLVVLRYAGESGGKWCRYGVAKHEIPEVLRAWQAEGAKPELVQVNEAADDSKLVFQGECAETPAGLALRYSTVPKPMRQALAEGSRYANGLTAWLLIRQHMDPASVDDLRELLADFDGAAVEFSVWDHATGDAKRNTVFWEVRHY